MVCYGFVQYKKFDWTNLTNMNNSKKSLDIVRFIFRIRKLFHK